MDYWWQTKEYENVRITIICCVDLVLEDGLVIGFHTKTLEDEQLKYSDCIICGHNRSVFHFSGENSSFLSEKEDHHI